VGLIPEAFVFHKRRTTLVEFYKQVFNFGKGRAMIGKVHPGEVKLVHWFPSFFTMAMIFMLLLLPFSLKGFTIAFGSFLFYLTALFIHSWIINRNIFVALLSIPSVLLQFSGYGIGFLQERFRPYSV
jgi:hypothetical protein